MLLHGAGCDSHDWSWQLPVFEGKYRVVAADLRGHGRSEVMPPGSYQPDDYLADIEALIVAKYAGQKFIVVGHSLGGQIAARLAAKRPDLVSAIVAVDAPLGGSSELAPVYQKVVETLQVVDPAVLAASMFQRAYDPTTRAAFKRWHARRLPAMPPQVLRESLGPLYLGPRQVGLGSASEAFCKSLTVPFYHLVRDQAKATAMSTWFQHPKSKVELWKDAGHWIQQDRPDDFNSAVTSWIDAI